MKVHHVIGLCSLAAAVWTGAIAETPGVTEAERAELNDAIEKWKELGASYYSFDFQNLCNCSRDEIARRRLDVSDNTIKSAVYAENVYEHHFISGEHRYILIHTEGSEASSEISDRLVPIDSFMQEMKRVISEPMAEYEAEFDGGTGVPCRVYFDFSGGLVDDELEIVLSHFEFDAIVPELLDCAAGESGFSFFTRR